MVVSSNVFLTLYFLHVYFGLVSFTFPTKQIDFDHKIHLQPALDNLISLKHFIIQNMIFDNM